MPNHDERQLVIYGAGGHGRVCLDMARAAGWAVAGFCDSAAQKGSRIHGCAVIANDPTELAADAASLAFLPAVGRQDGRRRTMLAMDKTGLVLATVIHPAAVVSPHAVIGDGTVVMPGAIVAIDASIGRGCIINHGASVDHDNQLSDGAKIGPGSHLAGGVSVGAWANIGAGCIFIPGVSVGAGATIGAGAVVTQDIDANVTAVGIPARPLH